MAKSMEEIAELLQNTRFRPRLLGGVDEDDVWKKLARLQREYNELVEAERQRALGVIYEWRRRAAELEARLNEKDEQIRRLAVAELPGRARDARVVRLGDRHG